MFENKGVNWLAKNDIGGRASRSTTPPKQFVIHNSSKAGGKAERIMANLLCVVERDARPPMIGKAFGLTSAFLTPVF